MEQGYSFGAMLDLSRNGVMKAEQIKKFAFDISKMGYNALYLYIEDVYEIEDEPYFGHLRGKLLKSELKDINAYCKSIGVELVPCIQTLAHVNQIFQWQAYAPVHDTDDIMLIDEEKTYVLIEKMIKTMRECVDTNTINIGMDEAHMVGFGRFFQLHGYQNRFEILKRHLERVIEICKKYDFKPMMWADMFFRLNNNDMYYLNSLDEKKFKETAKYVPDGVQLCYWDYYHYGKDFYDLQFKAHYLLTDDVCFAGGCTIWHGFVPYNEESNVINDGAMDSCRENGVKRVFLTLWGDDGNECSRFSIMPALLYAIERYKGNTDMESIKAKFFDLFGVKYDDFVKLDNPKGISKFNRDNPFKYLFYNDPLEGKFDAHVIEGSGKIYGERAKEIKAVTKNMGEFSYIFDYIGSLYSFLELKSELGVNTRKAYLEKNDKELKRIANSVYPEAIKRLKKFYNAFKTVWDKENKPFGFDVQDGRIGGLILRLEHSRQVILDYLSEKTDSIIELEQPVLKRFLNDDDYHIESCYGRIVTASKLTHAM